LPVPDTPMTTTNKGSSLWRAMFSNDSIKNLTVSNCLRNHLSIN
jgi:hypothetical protein